MFLAVMGPAAYAIVLETWPAADRTTAIAVAVIAPLILFAIIIAVLSVSDLLAINPKYHRAHRWWRLACRVLTASIVAGYLLYLLAPQFLP